MINNYLNHILNILRYHSNLIYFHPKFVYLLIQNYSCVNRFISELKKTEFHIVLKRKPTILRNVWGPYIHNEWPVTQRFSHILGHYQTLNLLPKFFDITKVTTREVVSLRNYSSDAFVVLEHPVWFQREGELVISLFKKEARVMTVSFSFSNYKSAKAIYIGSIQGMPSNFSSSQSLGIIRGLTKDCYGLRPKSLLVEVIKMFAQSIESNHILAICDKNRHQRHPFFGGYLDTIPTTNYDDIWVEHSGVYLDNGFYSLPLQLHRREFSEISSNKRAMYRHRYNMLDDINKQIIDLLDPR